MSQTQRLEWKDSGVPVSTRFDDPYFSLENGLAETRHVFLDGNDLPARFAPGFHVAELGFGTGLNLLALWQLWRSSGTRGQLHMTSFEAFPMPPRDMRRALDAFPELADLSAELLDRLTPDGFETDDLRFELVTGDARDTLPSWTGAADAWFLDGFSPAKNPELWSGELMQAVAGHTRPGGTCATYTAAGHVRR
ncbi:MAG: tRNA (5-methylaminomethyl-2-thiouridine)(34)-methyltransferase MnmD, partial [Pseudomonadota bacterium]